MTENLLSVDVKQQYKKKSQLKIIWRRFQKSKLAMFGLFLFITLIIIAASADIFFDYENDAINQTIKARLQFPSKDHPFGTDEFGRDMLARVIYGARISLVVGIASISFSLIAGSIIGSVAGYFGGVTDNIIMRLNDILLAIPQTIMAISIVAALGPGLINLLLALSISMIPRFARIVRASVLSIRGQEFIEAAKAYGSSNTRIIAKYILPNAIGPIIVQATLNMARTILAISALSFIGLGVQPPTPEWGSILAAGKTQMRYYPYLVTIPGIAIVLSVLALNMIGDGLRDALDPRLKN